MPSTVRSAELMDSIGQAAREVADHDIGMLPVLDRANLVGVLTVIDSVASPIGEAGSLRQG
jgi:CBS-domain-containing membrane protein